MEIMCHIVGITTALKNNFIKDMQNLGYHVIDLDEISNIILRGASMTQLYSQYQGFKDSKNDKYKEIDKKMTIYWETAMEENIINNINTNSSKKKILIGYSHHFRNINKRINVSPNNKPIAKFIIKVSKSDVRNIIKNNLEKFKDDIIQGSYPLENIDFDFIYNNRIKMDFIYEKNGYLPKNLETLYTILNLSNKNIEGDGLWIALKQPYNVSSKIYPKKNDKLFGFTDKLMALLSSFHFNDDELEKYYDNNISTVRVKPKKEGVLEKMSEKRYLYLVDKKHFVPHEKGNNVKFFSQEPATIIDIIKIKNVFTEYFNN
jgi:hypothetical protein